MDILKRSLAPITDEAWQEIDEQAEKVIKGNLSARFLMNVKGPFGWDYSALNLGGLEIGSGEPVKGVTWGKRVVQPLTEIRVPFTLSIMELDNISRGYKTPELEPVIQAAQKAAQFEEMAIYKGFDKGSIKGLLKATPNKPVSLPKKADEFIAAVETAKVEIEKNAISGPYAMVLGSAPFKMMMENSIGGYPLPKRIKDILGGDILWSPMLDGGIILSTRGGDFEITLGQDFSIGYASHDRENVELYIAQSMTFQILEPAAAVELKSGK